MNTVAEFAAEFSRLSRKLDQGLAYLREQTKEWAQAEHDYRLLRSECWVTAPEGTVAEREAWVDGRTAKARYRRDLADGMRRAALEAVKSRQTQISSLQSLLKAHQAEAEIAKYGRDAA